MGDGERLEKRRRAYSEDAVVVALVVIVKDVEVDRRRDCRRWREGLVKGCPSSSSPPFAWDQTMATRGE